MINITLKAVAVETPTGTKINLVNVDGDTVATFHGFPFFYVVTGFKTVDAFNANQEEQPTKFLLWKREH